MQFKVVIDGELIVGKLNRRTDSTIEATIADRSYEFTAVAGEPSIYWLKLGESSIEAVVTSNGGQYTVSIGQSRFQVEIEDARSALRRKGSSRTDGPAEIRSPMPGKVVRMLVLEGDQVQENDGIVVIEAMKMQNAIKSPRTGAVKFHVVTGAAVNAGELLATVG
jgi:biotin carboxyl carrier protein